MKTLNDLFLDELMDMYDAEQRIVRARVPFHTDAVECLAYRRREGRLRVRRAQRRIGDDHRQHGRHARADHSRPFRHPGQTYVLAADRPPVARHFTKLIRRHDPLSG